VNPYAGLDDEALLAECRVEMRRASGPGGQHRNKVESAVRLLHAPTGVVAQASERRSQHANRTLAIERLRAKLERFFHRERPRVKTRKSKGIRAREVDAKKKHGMAKRLRRGPAGEE
jgi:protein subunit release factor B